MGDLTRVTIDLPTNLIVQLQNIADKRNLSIRDAILRGLETDLYISNAENSGAKILIKKNDNSITEMVRK